jgi:hypothetical protein
MSANAKRSTHSQDTADIIKHATVRIPLAGLKARILPRVETGMAGNWEEAH